MISVEIMNMLTNIIDISGGISVNQKEEQSKFEKILQRILGLCFDNNKEIDVQGTAKLGQLDNIDQSFFEMAPVDLKNIEIEVWERKYFSGESNHRVDIKFVLPNKFEIIIEINEIAHEKEEKRIVDLTRARKICDNNKKILKFYFLFP